MPLKPEAQAIVDAASAAFPKLGTEVLDATEARRMLAARPAAPIDPIPVGRVEELSVPGPAGAPEVRVRVYRPDSIDALPVVMFCHGGGFTICGLDSHDQLCRTLADGAGAVVVSVDYRQAPEHRFPAAADDAYAVLCWIAENADAFGGDPRRIAVAGDSSGGNLAAVTSLMARDRNGPGISGQALIYPMLDPARDTVSYRENARGYFVTDDHLRWYWEQYLGPDGDEDNPYAAPPRTADLTDLPPAHIVTAEFDPLRDEGEAYGERLRASGVETEVIRYDGQFHGFVSMADQLADAKAACAEICSALRRFLGVAR
ncbi:alpha/beta hydrolase [Nocardia sp. NPDC050710]|uniref:alpha/beta hydrolase n=1 Tax=Nocardia sp. NPDC050710 TaxID=3157220 RepID=UPI0033FB9D60